MSLASEAGLDYVADDAGLRRIRRGRGFSYLAPKGRTIMARSRPGSIDCMIPPAWDDVSDLTRPVRSHPAHRFPRRGRSSNIYHPAVGGDPGPGGLRADGWTRNSGRRSCDGGPMRSSPPRPVPGKGDRSRSGGDGQDPDPVGNPNAPTRARLWADHDHVIISRSTGYMSTSTSPVKGKPTISDVQPRRLAGSFRNVRNWAARPSSGVRQSTVTPRSPRRCAHPIPSRR